MDSPLSQPVPHVSFMPVRPQWLALHEEPALQPELAIVDAHHHLWERPGARYMPDDLHADLGCGHNIVASNYLECGSAYRADGPEAMRPVGECEWVDQVARAWKRSGRPGDICRGFVGRADLRQGAAVQEVLEAYIEAAPRRMRGVRQNCVGDADPALTRPDLVSPADLFAQADFRQGFSRLAPLGLSFETWLYHPRIEGLIELADAFPETSIVLDHCGTPLGRGAYAKNPSETFAGWAWLVRRLAERPNVTMKLGGLGMWITGADFHRGERPPTSQMLAEAWRPHVETCIEAFGAERCMFQSNFPVDKGAYSYGVFWNACKRLAAGAGADQAAALFHGTANRVYRLALSGAG
jgi:predicted TIM-barrel fold metal-dependent hydrolase